MANILFDFSELLYLSFPIFLLFLLFMVGYWFACADFKPRPINMSEEYRSRSESYCFSKQKELSASQLGIEDLNLMGNVPMHVQRQRKMEERIKEYSSQTPEGTAAIIKNWLNDR